MDIVEAAERVRQSAWDWLPLLLLLGWLRSPAAVASVLTAWVRSRTGSTGVRSRSTGRGRRASSSARKGESALTSGPAQLSAPLSPSPKTEGANDNGKTQELPPWR